MRLIVGCGYGGRASGVGTRAAVVCERSMAAKVCVGRAYADGDLRRVFSFRCDRSSRRVGCARESRSARPAATSLFGGGRGTKQRAIIAQTALGQLSSFSAPAKQAVLDMRQVRSIFLSGASMSLADIPLASVCPGWSNAG